MMTPLVTVVIPTFANPSGLERAIHSILEANGPQREIVVVDQSTSTNDQTREVASRFDPDVVRYCHREERGRGGAIRQGCEAARGQFIAVTDDDVIVDANWLQNALESFETEYPCDAIVGRILPYGERPGPKYLDPQSADWEEDFVLQPTSLKGFGANQFFRRETLHAIGGFDARLGVGSKVGGSDDWDILYRIMMRGMTVRYIRNVMLFHDGWELESERRRKARSYNRSQMAMAIKNWRHYGGPCLGRMLLRCNQLVWQTLQHVLKRNRGTAWGCITKLGNYLSGIPLGLLLAFQRRDKISDGAPLGSHKSETELT